MPRLRHYDDLNTARFITFCCYHRYKLWSSYNWYMGRRDVPLEIDEFEGMPNMEKADYPATNIVEGF